MRDAPRLKRLQTFISKTDESFDVTRLRKLYRYTFSSFYRARCAERKRIAEENLSTQKEENK